MRALIKSRRPDVALLLRYNPDITFHEINNAVERPLPLWRYHTGEAAKTSASAYPEKPVAINAVMFWDLPYRFSAEQPGLTELVLAQVIANGANPYAYVLGHTRNQPDRKNYPAVRRMMRFHQANERHYEGLRSAAEVLLVSPTQAQAAYGDETRSEGAGGVPGRLPRPGGEPPPLRRPAGHRSSPRPRRTDASRATARSSCPTPPRSRTGRRRCSTATWRGAGGWWRPSRPAPTTSRAWRARKGHLALRSLGAARILARRDGYRELRGAYLRVTRREDLAGPPGHRLRGGGPGLPVRGAARGRRGVVRLPRPHALRARRRSAGGSPRWRRTTPACCGTPTAGGAAPTSRGRWTPCSTGTASRSRGPCWATPYGQ